MKNRRRSGFSLLKLLAMIATIGILLVMVLPPVHKFHKKTTLSAAADEAARLRGQSLDRIVSEFEQAKEDISLIIDPKEKEEAWVDLSSTIGTELDGHGIQATKYKKEIQEAAEAWGFLSANYKANIEDSKQALAAIELQIDALNKQNIWCETLSKTADSERIEAELLAIKGVKQ